jgi:uncharacterized protein YqeY
MLSFSNRQLSQSQFSYNKNLQQLSKKKQTDLGVAQSFLDQDPSQNLFDEEIKNMVDELTDAQPDWTSEVEPYPYQQQQMG